MRDYDAEDERRLELLQKLLVAMSNYSDEYGIRFLLVEGLYRPALDPQMQQQVHDAYGDQFDFDKVSRILAEFTNDQGIAFLSLPRLVAEQGLDVREAFVWRISYGRSQN